jgi:hypothetical protein
LPLPYGQQTLTIGGRRGLVSGWLALAMVTAPPAIVPLGKTLRFKVSPTVARWMGQRLIVTTSRSQQDLNAYGYLFQ